MTDEETRHWHLDRKVTLGLIAAIIMQTFTAAWWAATVSAAVTELQRVDGRHEVAISGLSLGRETNAGRITALEANMNSVSSHLDRIETKLDRVIEQKQP